MSDLLKVMSLDQKRGSIPLAVEFQVNRELHPYLVTAAGKSKFIWLTRTREGMIRAAFRNVGRSNLYLDIVNEIRVCSEDNDWGIVFGMTTTGIQSAVNRLAYYDFSEVDLLVPLSGIDLDLPEGVKKVESACVPSGMAVVVPRDRSCLGFVADMKDGNFLSVVHNPSRSICVVVDEPV